MTRPLELETPPSASDVIAAALDRFGDRLVLASSLGPQSLVILDLVARLGREVPVLLLDTGLLFPETYALKEQVEARYGITVRAVRPAARTTAPYASDPDRCCALRKVNPLKRALQGYEAWFTGLRRDQSTSRAEVRPVDWDDTNGLWRISPLHDWTQDEVLSYLRDNGLPYNPLLDRGFRSVGCAPCTRPSTDPLDERSGRWPGREKTECGIHFLFPKGA